MYNNFCRMKRARVYFAVALVLEFAVLLYDHGRLAVIFLIPGVILSSLISGPHSGMPPLILGLVVNAVLYTCLALLIEKAIRRRKLSN